MTTRNTSINRFSTLASDPLRSFRFQVEFTKADVDPFDNKLLSSNAAPNGAIQSGWIGGFSSVSGLSITTQSIPYREGGYNTTVHQIPGMTTFGPISLQRGVLYGNDQAITWMRGMFAAVAGDGLNTGSGSGKTFRVNMRIYVMDHPNTGSATVTTNKARMGFDIRNAWITQLNYTDLAANDGAILFESMQLVHEGLSVFFTKDDANFTPEGRTALA
jgi:phage tail-like protein